MIDKIILIGQWKTIPVFKDGGWVDGELIQGEKIADLRCILNPMSAKFLKNFESGQYTMQDMVAYSRQYVENWQNATVQVTNRYGCVEEFTIDDVKVWDDSELIKYLLKKKVGINGQ